MPVSSLMTKINRIVVIAILFNSVSDNNGSNKYVLPHIAHTYLLTYSMEQSPS